MLSLFKYLEEKNMYDDVSAYIDKKKTVGVWSRRIVQKKILERVIHEKV